MALVNGYLASRYITDKEPCLRELTNSVALAMCAKVDGGGRVALRRQRAARGMRLWKHRWLELILVIYLKLCSTGVLEASVQPVGMGSASGACTGMPLCKVANRVLPVMIVVDTGWAKPFAGLRGLLPQQLWQVVISSASA
jgi:hypothetical protein